MTTIKIGRDAESGKLQIAADGKRTLKGTAQSVPQSVSREHLLLTVNDEGIAVIKNQNQENDLYVNGYAVEQKRITQGDYIEMGRERYVLSWDILTPLIPKVADISHLEQVWKNYQDEKLRLQINERRSNQMRSISGLITTLAIILSATVGRGSWFIGLYILAGIISLVYWIKGYRSASRVPLQQQQLEEDTRKRYCCPVCGNLFNLQSYDLLRQMKKCSHCGALIKK